MRVLRRFAQEVEVRRPVYVGKDRYNANTYSYEFDNVYPVLCNPTEGLDITASNRPNGHIVKWTCYFPKSYTSSLENCMVKVNGKWYRVLNTSTEPNPNSPLEYDRTVYLGADND